jgi:beta-galactosidase/beta-glucuronidase
MKISHYEIPLVFCYRSNHDFIRTSHYPPTDSFLKLCDEYGIYVEDGTAVCLVNSNDTES